MFSYYIVEMMILKISSLIFGLNWKSFQFHKNYLILKIYLLEYMTRYKDIDKIDYLIHLFKCKKSIVRIVNFHHEIQSEPLDYSYILRDVINQSKLI